MRVWFFLSPKQHIVQIGSPRGTEKKKRQK
jgi:hypothetical protein